MLSILIDSLVVFVADMCRDHFRENVRRMRQIQRRAREKEEETVQPVKALWKSEKYREIPSRIKADLEVRSLHKV
mgnify:CR=1 FL=1